jgi:histidyl-tRNA synthetase
LREHFQLNVDIVGEAAVSADAELVAVCVEVMREVGLTATDVRVRVSDRRLLNSFLSGIGVTREQLVLVYAVVDKAARDPEQDLKQRLRDAGLAEPTITTLFDALQRTREGGIAEILRTGGLSESATTEIGERVAELERYLSYTEALGIRDWLVFDLSIVRGLAYYTGIVFELFDARGAYRAICGGGRYDSLLAALGGADLPALGFGMGDVVLCELLRERGLLKATPVSPEFWVAGETSDLLPDVMRVATALRRAGHSVEFALREQTLGRQIKAAAAAGARSAVIMRHDLLRSGRMTVRELESGVEAVVDVDSWRPATE